MPHRVKHSYQPGALLEDGGPLRGRAQWEEARSWRLAPEGGLLLKGYWPLAPFLSFFLLLGSHEVTSPSLQGTLPVIVTITGPKQWVQRPYIGSSETRSQSRPLHG